MALILASNSAIRHQMLAAAGVSHEQRAPDFDEQPIKQGWRGGPDELARRLAEGKAKSVAAGDDWVIGSDSAVEVEGVRYSKPRDCDEAARHLREFSGRTMRLSSAVALARAGRVEWSFADTALLHVRQLSDEFIAQYLDEEWPEVGYCVGVFRMEARGVTLFELVEGDHFTILGMPLLPLLGALRERGILPS